MYIYKPKVYRLSFVAPLIMVSIVPSLVAMVVAKGFNSDSFVDGMAAATLSGIILYLLLTLLTLFGIQFMSERVRVREIDD